MRGRWRVRCRVSGGVTGTREAWMKSGGIVADFTSEAEARETAEEMLRKWGRVTGNRPRMTATAHYWPVRVSDWPTEEA